MEPALRRGKIIFASPLLSVEKSDIVVARVEGRDVIKRVSRKTSGGVLLSGDNPRHSRDSRVYGEVSSGSVLGRVLGVRNEQQRKM